MEITHTYKRQIGRPKVLSSRVQVYHYLTKEQLDWVTQQSKSHKNNKSAYIRSLIENEMMADKFFKEVC